MGGSYHNIGSVMPFALETLKERALRFNRLNPRNFVSQYRCVSFFLNGSRLIATGTNNHKTHPLFKDYADNYRFSTHAEMAGIIQLIKMDTLDSVTDVVCFRGTRVPLPSEPCVRCMPNLKKFLPLTRLWFLDKNNNWTLQIL